jgi:hypothetical protein
MMGVRRIRRAGHIGRMGGEDKRLQLIGGKFRRKETTGNTKALVVADIKEIIGGVTWTGLV